MHEELFGEIGDFLASQRGDDQEERLLNCGILLALLCMRGVTTRSKDIELRPSDRDARRLLSYLVEPGLAPGLATVERRSSGGRDSWILHPNWERLAAYYGRSLADFERLLRVDFPRVLRRHRLTFEYMLADG